MNYEVTFGDFSKILEAANPYQACILALRKCIDERKTFPVAPFQVLNLDNGSEEEIEMSMILNLLAVAAEEVTDEELIGV